MKAAMRAALSGLAIAAAGCGAGGGVEPIWILEDRAPAWADAPSPSDAMLGPDGRIEPLRGLEAIAPANAALLRSHLATLDGFGLRPLAEIPVGDGFDPALLPARSGSLDAPAFFVDVDPISPERGRVIEAEWRFDPARSVIGGAPVPGEVLAEGRRYAAVVTTALGLREAPALGRAAEITRWASTAEAADYLRDEHGIAVAALAVFTTQRATAPLFAARAGLEGGAPRISFGERGPIFGPAELDRLLGRPEPDALGEVRWGWSSRGGLAHASVGVIASGNFHRQGFRRPDLGDDSPDDETFTVDAAGAPIPQGRSPIPVTLILPRAAPPAAGYPVLIIGHGLGASRHAMLTFAEPLTAAGYALIGIDMEGHGSRYSDLDQKNNTAEVVAAFNGSPDLLDGFSDVIGPVTTFDLLEGLLNLSAVRDSLRQSVLDLSQLAIALQRGAVELDALAPYYGGRAPLLDATRLVYLGESFGAVIGSVLAAVEPRISLYILDVGGGGVIDLAISSAPALSALVTTLGRGVYELEGRFDRFHPLVSLGQALIDGADPLSFARYVFREPRLAEPRHLLSIEVYGDEVMPNIATEALARAMGLELLEPHVRSIDGVGRVRSPAAGNLGGSTAVIVQYAPATHGANWSSEVAEKRFYPAPPGEIVPLPEPIRVRNPVRATFAQVIGAIASFHAREVPEIRSTCPPWLDFDDDGVGDAQERLQGRDPYRAER